MELKSIFRIAEFIICVVLIIIWYALLNYANEVMIICGSVAGYTVITGVLFARELLSFNSTVIFLLIGVVAFLSSGVLTVIDLPEFGDARSNSLFACVLLFANGVLFLIDFICLLKDWGGGSGSSE